MHLRLQSEDHEDRQEIAEINIIPLVDVMLVLLIIFMVTAPLSIGGLAVNLPSSKAKSGKVDDRRIVLTVTNAGKFYIDTAEMDDAQLEKYLATAFGVQKDKSLYIKGDRDVPYGRVVHAMSVAKAAGVRKIAMLTQPVEGR